MTTIESKSYNFPDQRFNHFSKSIVYQIKLLIKNAFKHQEPDFIWYRLDQRKFKGNHSFKSAGAPQFLRRTGAPASFGSKPRFSGTPVNRDSPTSLHN